MNTTTAERPAIGQTAYDLAMRSLHGRPDVTATKQSSKRTFTAVLEQPQTWIVQTYRDKERGDTVFVEYIGPEGAMRIALPPEVAACIASQREALTTKNRKRAARAEAARRKAAGIKPAFLNGGKGKGKARKASKGPTT